MRADADDGLVDVAIQETAVGHDRVAHVAIGQA